ncbi:hypothetical protein BDV59DRAFT_167173 [Aspergillus ambiguus]|uniref:uncharacterized protein n=1 Tax=Aspergillus ambiguus TaxID=176160 RepID=UPI003CCDCDEC
MSRMFFTRCFLHDGLMYIFMLCSPCQYPLCSSKSYRLLRVYLIVSFPNLICLFHIFILGVFVLEQPLQSVVSLLL